MDVGLENKYTRELTEEELTRLRDEVAKYMTEGDLVRLSRFKGTSQELHARSFLHWRLRTCKGHA